MMGPDFEIAGEDGDRSIFFIQRILNKIRPD
jgi:hypothetical protein